MIFDTVGSHSVSLAYWFYTVVYDFRHCRLPQCESSLLVLLVLHRCTDPKAFRYSIENRLTEGRQFHATLSLNLKDEPRSLLSFMRDAQRLDKRFK